MLKLCHCQQNNFGCIGPHCHPQAAVNVRPCQFADLLRAGKLAHHVLHSCHVKSAPVDWLGPHALSLYFNTLAFSQCIWQSLRTQACLTCLRMSICQGVGLITVFNQCSTQFRQLLMLHTAVCTEQAVICLSMSIGVNL